MHSETNRSMKPHTQHISKDVNRRKHTAKEHTINTYGCWMRM